MIVPGRARPRCDGSARAREVGAGETYQAKGCGSGGRHGNAGGWVIGVAQGSTMPPRMNMNKARL
jgi:hypothetical protein